MNSRVKNLRQQSLGAINTISIERALLLTQFYKQNESRNLPAPVLRAEAFKYILENKAICINKGELIVGERGPAPKATPTYPEISLHSVQDLEILDSRPKVSYKSTPEERQTYAKEIIPFWHGKSNRDKIMEAVDPQWQDAYQAGIFTEFQEQRAPGHTVLGEKIFKKGLCEIIKEIDQEIQSRKDQPSCKEALNQLIAMRITAEALIKYANRHADAIKLLANTEADPERKAELQQMEKICRKVPANAPENVHEALQYYWFVHLGVITELNPWDAFNPGRLDQHIFPFYKAEMQDNPGAEEKIKELFQCFWVKFNNHPAPPKVGVTALESNTYTDFALINLGGVTPEGNNAVNALTYLILDVIQEMRLLQPSSMVQISTKNPDKYIHRVLEITATGFGQPSYFNTEGIVKQLVGQGKSLTDARNGGASGCVETGAFGTESYILTGYFNLTKVFELALNNGYDKRTKKQIGPKTGTLESFTSFNTLFNAFKKQLKHFIDIKIQGNNIIEKIFATQMPAPFLSLFIDDCITNAKDYNAGGARYNTSYIQGVGLGTLTDALTAIKYMIYDAKQCRWAELNTALDTNFDNHHALRKNLLYDTPKYGNDNEYADNQAIDIFNAFYESVTGRQTYRGGVFRINMLPTTSHVYFGSVCRATPDGRKAGEPLSEGISPVQGADKIGPTAVLKSAAKIDHSKTGGTLLNQKFTPEFFKSDTAKNKITALIRSYFKLGGHHIQFNVLKAETLRDAQKHPEKYQDLIVRVAGYSDYFNHLGEDLQNEIIKRTEHAMD